MLRPVCCCCLLMLFTGPRGAFGDDAPSRQTPAVKHDVNFQRDIQPIFAKHCYGCHGPDEQNASLRLDRKADAFRGGDSGKVFKPGNSAGSVLIKYVSGADPEKIMPPEGDRLTKRQIGLLRAWIDQGAEWPGGADVSSHPSAADHWAFQPVKRPTLPAVKNTIWVRNPIDRFVLAKLEKNGISPSPIAQRTVLIRRLSLDLLGLPPTPTEVTGFLNDNRPDAYEKLVDRLLASPHFGERWGRHWLDLARYADSDGYEDDKYRPDAWRFRDWVVSAVNADLPFDQFTIQQLAGGLIPNSTYEHKVAMGFHRMTLFNNAGVGRNDEEFRIKTAKDRANTTGTVWLGLTLRCAQCHSHKYDPLSQREYYQFFAFFNNLVDENIPAPPLPERYQVLYRKAAKAFEQRQEKAKAILAAYEKEILPLKQQQWEQSADSGELPELLATVFNVPKSQRTAEDNERLDVYFRSIDQEYVRLDSAVLKGDEIPNNRPLPPSFKTMTLAENAQPRKTYIHKRGNFLDKWDEVRPNSPEFLPQLKAAGDTPNRYDLARWIVDPKNPLTSRVAVNYIWMPLFNRGLVTTPDNFGTQGEPPTHPQLLDWLAQEFVEGGWSRKRMIKLIVTSATYRQSSRHRPELAEADPQNSLLAAQNRYRVEAEIVRDLALTASGLLTKSIGGPSIQPPLPESLMRRQELKNERFMEPSSGADRYRRGLYVNVQRTLPYHMMKEFDSADANVACTRRERSNTPLQALTLLNDPVFVECARSLGLRLLSKQTGNSHDGIRWMFRTCLGREPDELETASLVGVYETHWSLYRKNWKAARQSLGRFSVPQGISESDAAAWIAVARTLMNLDEFITRE